MGRNVGGVERQGIVRCLLLGFRGATSRALQISAYHPPGAACVEFVRAQLDLVEYDHELCGRYSRVATRVSQASGRNLMSARYPVLRFRLH
jgi:hypothetical protein